MKCVRFIVVAATAAFVAVGAAQAGPTLEAIQKRGALECGVSTGLPGFSIADPQGNWYGLDVDICRAIAAAVLGDANKVKFTPLNAQDRFGALQSGKVDVLSRNTTWTLSRDAGMGFNFTVATFYDGQAFMVPASANIKSALELNGKTICVQSGTTNEINVAEYAESKRITLNQLVFPNPNEARIAFINGRCAAVTSDASQLASLRAADPSTADNYVILPERISKEPLGPLVRRGDEEWFAIVKWTLYALILAEERGIARSPQYDKDGYSLTQTVEETAKDTNPESLSLIGASPGMGKILGLSNDWASTMVKQVGNYGEIFERNVGPKTPLKLERGLNALWSDGGLMYAMPVR